MDTTGHFRLGDVDFLKPRNIRKAGLLYIGNASALPTTGWNLPQILATQTLTLKPHHSFFSLVLTLLSFESFPDCSELSRQSTHCQPMPQRGLP